MLPDPMIETHGLARSFKTKTGPVAAVQGIDFEVRPGQIVGLLGPNGAGKTSLIKILVTLLAPTTGRAMVAGFDVGKDPKAVRPLINMVSGGESSGYGLLTVRENLWLFGQFYGLDNKTTRARTDELLEIVGLKDTRQTVATDIEMFRKLLDSAKAGDNVGVLLRGTKKEDVERGMVLAKPGSITPHMKFKAEVYVLSKDEGGRHTPFFTNYRPQFYFRTTDVTGAVELPEGAEMVMPGDNIQMKVELISPIAMEEGLRFAIREGGRTVGAGVVAKIIQ